MNLQGHRIRRVEIRLNALSLADDCEGRLKLPGTAKGTRGQLDSVVFKAGWYLLKVSDEPVKRRGTLRRTRSLKRDDG